MKVKNASFKLQIEANGTYLQLFQEEYGGKPLTIEAVAEYFSMIHFDDYNKTDLSKKIREAQKNGLIKISNNRIRPIDEYISVYIDETESEAFITFYAPSNGGKTLSKEEIIESLHHNKIKYGIDEAFIEEWMKNRIYNTTYVVAKAKEPKQGQNGKIVYCFNTNATAQPRINEDGTVDYHQLDNIVHVKEGERLAYLVEAIPGEHGMLVNGTRVEPAKIKTPKLKTGRNMHLSEDGKELISDVAGHAYLVDDKVFVANIYEVLADVDASTGDIEYDGDIHVKGSVRSGFSLRATGQIYVEGVVEGANLFAEGPIIIKGGIQGMMKAKIVSHSNVTVKFIENASVEAGGDMLTEAIMHSHVGVSGKISVEGKKGLIVGGEVQAGNSVKFKLAGSKMGAFTSIKVGINPVVLREFHEVEEETRKLEAEYTQLATVLSAYRTKLTKGLKLNANQVLTIKHVADRIKELDRKLPEMRLHREELGEKIVLSNKGKVVVEDKVFPGVKIEISSAVLIVKTETHYCSFIKDGIDVVSRPL